MPLATLDLGELGEQIDAALMADSDLEDLDAPGADGAVAQAGDDQGEHDESPGGEAPAADAGDDFEARYQERFAADYAARSKQDIGKLQSKLDRQIHELRTQGEDLGHSADEAEHAVGFLLKQLREYDPEAADRFEQGRKATQAQLDRDRKLARYERQQADDTRAGWYAAAFPDGDIAADDEDLVAALKQGKDFEQRVLKLKVKALGLEYDPALGRFARAGAGVQQKVETPPASEPKAVEPVRNEKGQFVANKVAATRQREQERGTPPLISRTGAGERPATTIPEARSQFLRGLQALGAG